MYFSYLNMVMKVSLFKHLINTRYQRVILEIRNCFNLKTNTNGIQ